MKARLTIVGTTPLLMHAATLADPLHPATKEFKKVSGKRTKTDADHEAMARLEFAAGLYLDESGNVVIPSPNITKNLIEGARVTKSGPKIERGVVAMGTDFPLIYDGPRTSEGLYADRRFISRMSVKVGTARTMRVRPMFREWALEADLFTDDAVINLDDLAEIASNAGRLIGLGDYRKGGGFGRYEATVTAL